MERAIYYQKELYQEEFFREQLDRPAVNPHIALLLQGARLVMSNKPKLKPDNPKFSSGPASKRPGWSLANLDTTVLGRSHRAALPLAKLKEVIALSKEILGIPEDYLLGIVPASNTGAFEMALWSMLGARGVDLLVWESFGAGWAGDVKNQLQLKDVREFHADYGDLPDLSQVDAGARDVIFTWNGTTSGVCLAHADWIPEARQALSFCDATSAVYAMPVDWQKLDVTTWSWQKVLGGEAAHGMLALSPQAVARLENYQPAWPLPKIFRMTKAGKVNQSIFGGATINTPSMLAVVEHLDALHWAKNEGGLDWLIKRSQANLKAVSAWVDTADWVDFLAREAASRSSTSICLKIQDPWFTEQSEAAQRVLLKKMTGLLEAEVVAFDINNHRDAPPGLRIWGGATVTLEDITRLLPWLDWAWESIRAE